MRLSVVGNVNIDLSAFINESKNVEENRIKEMMFTIGWKCGKHGNHVE
jgi:ribokinase